MALNERFGVDLDSPRWKQILEPAGDTRLCSVCDEIARHASKRVVEPVRVLGRECHEAGVFFAVKQILKESGLDVSEIRPSSPVFPCLRKHWPIFLGEIAILAPGRLPPFHAKDRVYNVLLLILALGFLGAPGLGAVNAPGPIAAVPALLGFAAYLALWVRVMSRRALDEAAFGDILTFGDLCRTLAGTRDQGRAETPACPVR